MDKRQATSQPWDIVDAYRTQAGCAQYRFSIWPLSRSSQKGCWRSIPTCKPRATSLTHIPRKGSYSCCPRDERSSKKGAHSQNRSEHPQGHDWKPCLELSAVKCIVEGCCATEDSEPCDVQLPDPNLGDQRHRLNVNQTGSCAVGASGRLGHDLRTPASSCGAHRQCWTRSAAACCPTTDERGLT